MSEPDGIVYVLSNRGFWLPEHEDDSELVPVIKIGHTKSPTAESLKKRMDQLFRDSVALPFDLEYAKTVVNPAKVEARLHKTFTKLRVNPNREWFLVDVDSVIAALEPDLGNEITLDNNDEISDDVKQSDIAARNKVAHVPSSKRVFSFEFLELPIGTKLTAVTDPSETAVVVNDTEVEYNGEIMGASVAVTKIHQAKYRNKTYRSAFHSWKYKGKTLDKIHRKITSNS